MTTWQRGQHISNLGHPGILSSGADWDAGLRQTSSAAGDGPIRFGDHYVLAVFVDDSSQLRLEVGKGSCSTVERIEGEAHDIDVSSSECALDEDAAPEPSKVGRAPTVCDGDVDHDLGVPSRPGAADGGVKELRGG